MGVTSTQSGMLGMCLLWCVWSDPAGPCWTLGILTLPFLRPRFQSPCTPTSTLRTMLSPAPDVTPLTALAASAGSPPPPL